MSCTTDRGHPDHSTQRQLVVDATGDLRHMFRAMAGDQQWDNAKVAEIARGLLGPAIERLERAVQGEPPVAPREPVTEQQLRFEIVGRPEKVITRAEAETLVADAVRHVESDLGLDVSTVTVHLVTPEQQG